MQRLTIRSRQIKALYQREITALHRSPRLSGEEQRRHAAELWLQATEQLASLRAQAETIRGELTPEEQALFAPPNRPDELEEAPQTGTA